MIQKSMAPRRARPTPRERYGSVNKRNASRPRTRGSSSRSGSVTRGERPSLDHARDVANQMDCREDNVEPPSHMMDTTAVPAPDMQYTVPFPETRAHTIQPIQPIVQLPEFNPNVMK